ncbi:MAG TPA: DUF819 family protein [Saprospiraceae bacterium]|nr:DUF819 family protein [Saprospiraceae bacterium]HMP14078.1 DUF819 family protein [Saprospiraceae bacterium]
MIWKILLILTLLLFPFAGKWLAARPAFKALVSPIIICYGMGILLGNIEIFPIDRPLARSFSEGCILFAIPLLLYPTNLPQWLRYANKTLLSFVLCAVGGLLSNLICIYFFQHHITQIWKMSGMVAGLYTGGTPNMQGVGFALQAEESVIVTINAADILTGGIYLLLLTSVAARIFGWILPAFQSTYALPTSASTAHLNERRASRLDYTQAIILTIGVIILSLGCTWLLYGNLDQPIFILLAITTISVGLSFVSRIRYWPGTFEAGEYFLLVFCIAIGALANFREIIAEGQYIIGFVACVLAGTIVLHTLLSRLFGIDRDTMMLTSTAALYGPAFVGQIAAVIGNKELVFSGIAMGLLGYVIGNYWGIGVAYIVKWYLQMQ